MHTAQFPPGVPQRWWISYLISSWDKIIDSDPELESLWILNVRGGFAILDREGLQGTREGRARIAAAIIRVCDPALRRYVLYALIGPIHPH